MSDDKPRRFRLFSRAGAVRLGLLLVLMIVALPIAYLMMVRMPGTSHAGPLPPLSPRESDLARMLERDVRALAEVIGPRNVGHPTGLEEAREYLRSSLDILGADVELQTFDVEGVQCSNIIVERPGVTAPEEIVVVGAHYDSRYDTPGADDNASGTAATLALARHYMDRDMDRTIRFVFFVNEEPPYFRTADMGSTRQARRSRERGEKIVAMLSLEMLGYYRTDEGSQKYPWVLRPVYPTTGDFITFVGRTGDRHLVRRAIRVFRDNKAFPSEGGAPPGWLEGIGWSDHSAYWEEGYSAIMVTDTAHFRNPNYHQRTDTSDTLDYTRMARVVDGLTAVIDDLAGR